MKRLIIADIKSHNNNGKCTGHYFPIAQNYLQLYGKIIPTKIAGGPIYKSKFAPSDMFQLSFDSIDSGSPIRNKWRTLRNCKHLLANTDDTDVVVMQHSGASTTFLGIALLAGRKNNIYVIQYDTDALSSGLKRLIYRFAKKKLRGIICPNDEIGKAYGVSYCTVTDYIYPDFDKQLKAESPQNKKYDFSIVGGVAPDKGTIDAAKYISTTNLRLLVAGNASDEESRQLQDIANNHSNVELHLGYINDEDYNNYIRNARYCLLNYRGVYSERSSGVVLDILFNGIPVVGRRCKALSFIEEEGVGHLYDSLEELNMDDLMDENRYEKYQECLNVFLKKQKTYRDRMVNFLNIEYK